jgi:repressor LexA
VKRLLKGRNKFKLQLIAENDDFSPIEVDLRYQQFTIEGISVGVIRRSL